MLMYPLCYATGAAGRSLTMTLLRLMGVNQWLCNILYHIHLKWSFNFYNQEVNKFCFFHLRERRTMSFNENLNLADSKYEWIRC